MGCLPSLEELKLNLRCQKEFSAVEDQSNFEAMYCVPQYVYSLLVLSIPSASCYISYVCSMQSSMIVSRYGGITCVAYTELPYDEALEPTVSETNYP